MGHEPERLWELLSSYVAAEGVELDDIETTGRSNGRTLRVIVDAEGGIGVDRIAALSRGMAALLDDEEPFAGSYTLEVSSPGLERSLRRPSHYRKSVGREVKVKTIEPVDGARSHRGALVEADDEGFAIEVDGHRRRLKYSEVDSARTVFVWEKSPKPGKRS